MLEEIEAALKCAFCQEEFTDGVKLLPGCGESICDRCHEQLRSEVGHERRFKCRACQSSHKMPRAGLVDCTALTRLAERLKANRALDERAEEARDRARAARSRLAVIADRREIFGRNCDRLRLEVSDALDAVARQAERVRDDLLREIEEHRVRFDSAESAGELEALVEETKRFKRRWRTRELAAVSEDDVEAALEQAAGFEARLDALEGRSRTEAPQMVFKALLDPWTLRNAFLLSLCGPVKRVGPAPVRTLAGHSDCVGQTLFLSDGRLVSASRDKSVRVWSVGGERRQLVGHGHYVVSLALLPGNRLASGSVDNSVRVWDLEARETRSTRTLLGHTGAVVGLEALKSGRLTSYALDDSIRIWDLESDAQDALVIIRGHGNSSWLIQLFGVLSNGRLVACSPDGLLRTWDPCVDASEPLQTVPSGHVSARSMLVLADDRVVVGFFDGAIRIMDLVNSSRSRSIEQAHGCLVFSLTSLPGGGLLSCGVDSDASASYRTIKLWSLADLGLLQTVKSDELGAVARLALSPDGKLLASPDWDRTIKLWPLNDA